MKRSLTAIVQADGTGFVSPRPVWKSTAALISLLLAALALELFAAMEFGRQLLGPAWFGPARESAALGVGAALTAFHVFVGRPLLRRHFTAGDPSRLSLTAAQAAAVVAVLIAGGAFGTWLFCRDL